MRRYETIIIMDPDHPVEKQEPVLKRVEEVIAQQGGYLAFIDDWGSKKLAYAIKKKERGHYIRFDFCGTGAVVNEMERFFRIDDSILKYMTVLLDEKADIEKIKEEVAARAIQTAAAKEQAAPAETVNSQEPTEPSATPVSEPAAGEAEATSAETEEENK
jgi:small subunit ribosomal protein S6